MNTQILRYFVDIGLLIAFLAVAITGLFKWTLLLRTLGLTGYVFPLALMSDIHDWSGIALVIFVGIHLILNIKWMAVVTRKILSGKVVD